MKNPVLHVGLVVNPLAGLGGSLALKGSDGVSMRELASTLSADQLHRAQERTVRALSALKQCNQHFRFSCWQGAMGELALQLAGFDATVFGDATTGLTSASDTRNAVFRLLEAEVDILLFAGGDGTARDIYDVVGTRCPVLGIPAGVKMHSGVFAVSPESAGELLVQLAQGGLVGIKSQEVREIDEDAFRADIVRSRFYGELLVPSEGQFLQHTKVAGREDNQLVAADIAAWQVETMQEERIYLIGPGSTTAAIMAELGLPNTLLGVDVVCNRKLLQADVSEEGILQLLGESAAPVSIIVTAIGGQGYIFGRGNQQFSPAVIRKVGLVNIIVVATKSKIADLASRPLLVDTNEPALDQEFSGLRTINTGYDDHVLYRVSAA
jgi:predicted polyphosphate/ATP-dependent NAD kinase